MKSYFILFGLDLIFQIKKTDEKPQGAEGDEDDSDSDYSNEASPFDRIAVYKQMLDLMKPGESVAKSLRRLGELIYVPIGLVLFIVLYIFCTIVFFEEM